MAKLYLKFKGAVIREIILQNGITTIGRLEKNDIHIDNLAVSGSHARIISEGDKFAIEDLNSTNGTYINDRRISRQALVHNTVITVGKHNLLFLDPDAAAKSDNDQTVVMRKPASGDATVVIAPPKQVPQMDQTIVRGASSSSPPVVESVVEKIGKLTELGGTFEGTDYILEKKLVTIGKSETAEIRLKGFFAPKVAAVINRTREGYFITPAAGNRKLLVNGSPIAGARQLKPFDIVEVASLRWQFSFQEG
jgi:pSer/pThr/pTyr-binding forkhead associated (FHA) protein